MQAVILAAGLGKRLGELKGDLPKGFLYIDELEESLVERSIRLLSEVGISSIIIGTGYKAEAYDKLASNLSHLNITTCKNPNFANSGSAYTLHCLRDIIDDDFLLLESDLLYEKLALEALLQDSRSDIVLGSGWSNSNDEVYMSISNDKLRNLGKDKMKLESLDAELVGISKISLRTFRKLDCLKQDDYEYLLKGFYVKKIDNLIWCEIDCLEHLNRARDVIIPKLLSKEIV